MTVAQWGGEGSGQKVTCPWEAKSLKQPKNVSQARKVTFELLKSNPRHSSNPRRLKYKAKKHKHAINRSNPGNASQLSDSSMQSNYDNPSHSIIKPSHSVNPNTLKLDNKASKATARLRAVSFF